MCLFVRRSHLLGASLVLACGAGCSAPSPPETNAPPRSLSRAQALADLTRFEHLKTAADAGLYKYHPKAQLDSAFAAARARLSPRPTVLEVYRLLVEVTDYEGSLHNDTFLPDSVRRSLHAQAAFFPYPLKEVAGQVVVNTRHAPLPLGARVVSLNEVPATQLVRRLGKYYTTDGVNQTGKRVGFAADFPDYYRLEFGPQSVFRVRYVPVGVADTLQQTLPAVPYARYKQAFAARHSRPLDAGFFDDSLAPYKFTLQPAQGRAILTVNTFDLGEEGTPGHRRYTRFLAACFTRLRHTPAVTQLLVDVRNNGGGNDNNDMHTFAYLAHAPFREHRAARVTFQRVPYRAWLTTQPDTTERVALERVLHRDFQPDGAGQLREVVSANPLFALPATHFRGQLYLLLSERVASAGSMFAAMVRGNTTATIIGEETMGGYYGHTGHESLTYTLPATGIGVQFACVDLDQQVPRRPSQPPGRGVLPDYAVTQSLPDFLANRDTQLRFALALMTRLRRPSAPAQ